MWEHSLLKIIFLENDHSGVTVKVGALKNNKIPQQNSHKADRDTS